MRTTNKNYSAGEKYETRQHTGLRTADGHETAEGIRRLCHVDHDPVGEDEPRRPPEASDDDHTPSGAPVGEVAA